MFTNPPKKQKKVVFFSLLEYKNEAQYISCDLPIIFRLKVANGYESCSTPHCKLVLQRRPFYKRGGTVDPENNKGGFPHAVLLTPYISIPVRSTSHNTIAFRSPVNALKRTQKQWTLTGHSNRTFLNDSRNGTWDFYL